MTKCKECRFWNFVGNYGPLTDGEEIGECRRRSPAPASGQQHQLMQMLRVIALSAAKASKLEATAPPEIDEAALAAFSAIRYDLNQPAGWPVTFVDAWCGEFELPTTPRHVCTALSIAPGEATAEHQPA